MQVSSLSFSPFARLASSLSIRAPRSAAVSAPVEDNGATVRDLSQLSLQLRRAVESLRGVAGLRRTGSAPRAAQVQSSNPLEISTVSTAANLRSREEVNTVLSSFTPRGPNFSGSSTSSPTIGGEYDGSLGDERLTFRAAIGGVVGVTPVRLEVLDEQNQVLETVDFIGYTPGQQKTLSTGLTISLGSGSVNANDTFEVDVSISVSSSVDPSKAFNGTRNEDPNFQPGFAVTAGTLQVNGTQIAVNANDSIESLLTRITASAAGVTATFDAATESVVFTQKTFGSVPTVTLGADTSGFFAATKLSGAAVTAGTDDDRTKVIANVAALSGIKSGTFAVNGTTFTVDILTDSLDAVMAQINEGGANASATIDTSSKEFRIVSTNNASLSLGDGTSDFFTGLGVTTGEFGATAGGRRKSEFRDRKKLQQRLEDLGRALDEVFKTDFAGSAAVASSFAKSALRSAITKGFGASSSGSPLQRHGLEFRFDNTKQGVFDVDFSRLREAVKRDPIELAKLLGTNSSGGVLDHLDGALGDIADYLGRYLGAGTGALVDIRG